MSVKNMQRELLIAYFLESYSDNEGFCILESGHRDNKPLTYIFMEPVCKIWADKNGSYVHSESKIIQSSRDPWHALDHLSEWQREIRNSNSISKIPNIAGYISYEMLHEIEDIPYKNDNSQEAVPLYVFYVYRSVAEILGDEISLHIAKFAAASHTFWQIFDERTNSVVDDAHQLTDINSHPDFEDAQNFLANHSNFTRERYCSTINKIKDLIKEGNVYQINLSQQFDLPFEGSAKRFYMNLRAINPAAYSSFLCSAGPDATFTIAGASPELFFSLSEKRMVCSPIKGTRGRSFNMQEDTRLKEELASSQKDRAELSMIVDLVRNDMSKVAETASVMVEKHARIESLTHVHHLVSDISCRIKRGTTLSEIIRALFPCGSITGAPKIASMRYIADFEQIPRQVYTGSIGWLSGNGAMQFNVAIRTALLRNSRVTFNAGGGITIDSDPQAEYTETIHKALGLYHASQIFSETM